MANRIVLVSLDSNKKLSLVHFVISTTNFQGNFRKSLFVQVINCLGSGMWPMVIYFYSSAWIWTLAAMQPISRRITDLAFVLSEQSSCSSSPVLLLSESLIMPIFAPNEPTVESDISPTSSNTFETESLGESSVWSVLDPNGPICKSVCCPA